MASKRVAAVDRSRCASCGACENVCPRSAIKVKGGYYAVVDEEQCVGCGKCANICPAGSIEIKERAKA